MLVICITLHVFQFAHVNTTCKSKHIQQLSNMAPLNLIGFICGIIYFMLFVALYSINASHCGSDKTFFRVSDKGRRVEMIKIEWFFEHQKCLFDTNVER